MKSCQSLRLDEKTITTSHQEWGKYLISGHRKTLLTLFLCFSLTSDLVLNQEMWYGIFESMKEVLYWSPSPMEEPGSFTRSECWVISCFLLVNNWLHDFKKEKNKTNPHTKLQFSCDCFLFLLLEFSSHITGHQVHLITRVSSHTYLIRSVSSLAEVTKSVTA